ncbi:MAG: hypothetical protein JXX28_15300 [Deltaproteobacteria bacterium]|nr:hypothetical protein [Deltaproteobacteria bacterium]
MDSGASSESGPWLVEVALLGFWLRGADELAESAGPARVFEATHAALSGVDLTAHDALLLDRGPDRLIVAIPDPVRALQALLDLRGVVDGAVAPFGLGPVSAAIGFGPTLLGGDVGAWGAELARVGRLLAPWVGGDLACTAAFYQRVKLPEGIGSFRARHALEHLAGAPYHLLFDGRAVD